MASAAHSFPIALTIAGFDPSGEAGVLTDARTFAAFGFRASAAITSLTFQNSKHVFGALHQSGEAVRAQVIPLLDDYRILCSKIGMLPTRDVVCEVARLFRENDLPSPVVDPVIISTSGQRLMEEDALDSLILEGRGQKAKGRKHEAGDRRQEKEDRRQEVTRRRERTKAIKMIKDLRLEKWQSICWTIMGK